MRHILYCCLFILLFTSLSLDADHNSALQPALKCVQEGNPEGTKEKCGEVMFADGQPKAQIRAYVLSAMALKLLRDPDLADRCEGYQDLLAENQDPDRANALALINFIAGKQSEDDLKKQLATADKDWAATADVCRYLMMLEKDPDVKKLYDIYMQYSENVAGLNKDDWAVSWRSRFPKWQKKVQGSTLEDVEKLIAECSTDKLKEKVLGENQAQIEAINQVIVLYLAADSSGASRLAGKHAGKFRQEDSNKYRLVCMILDYLSGKKQTSQRDIFEQAQTNPPLWALGSIAMFVRDVSANERKQLDQRMLLHHIDNYNGNHHLLKDHQEIARWKARTGPWEKWCLAKFTSKEGLEALLANKSKPAQKTAAETEQPYQDITVVTIAEFKASREPFKERPKPASLDFEDSKFSRYLSSVPEKLRLGEKRRYGVVKEVKHQLVKIMERNTYRGMVQTKKGSRRGLIQMANVNLIIFKKSDSSKQKRYKWSDLKFNQYILFFEHYAKQRMAVTAGQYGKKESHFYAANDYLALAILCDWFGHYEEALKYSQKAVKIAPDIKLDASKIMMQ